MVREEKTIIIIAGPTAVGKTSNAIAVAKHFNTEIISADSRQCYKELNIGVARPSVQELSQVHHYFIASHSINQKVDAAAFEQYALEKMNHIFSNNDIAVIVGGTGLYIKALCEGIDLIPEIPKEIRERIIHNYNEQGLSWLQEQIKNLDPQFYSKGEIQNPQRLMRALEVVMATGKSIFHFRKGEKADRPFNIIKLALTLPKEILHHNISYRVDKMMEMDLLGEVKSLVPYQHLNALQTVGYKELFDYLDDKTSLEEAIQIIKRHTRQYAKRQLTWFRKDTEYTWFDARETNTILSYLQKNVSD